MAPIASDFDIERPTVLADASDGVASLAALRGAMAEVFDIGVEAANDCGANLLARATRSYVLTVTELPPARVLRSHDAIARSGLDGFGIHLTLAGAAIGWMGERRIESRPGDVAIIDLSERLDLQFRADGERAAGVTLWVARVRVAAAVAMENLLHGLVLPADSPVGGLAAACLQTLRVSADTLPAKEFDAMADGVVAMIAKAITPLLEEQDTNAVQVSRASFVTIRRHIDKNLHSPTLDAARLAKTFGLSRAALYRLFEPVGGVASYIRRARLRRAYQEMISANVSGRRIAPIAYGLGFKNISAFNRLFRSTFGVSPSEARRTDGAGEPVVMLDRSEPGEGALGVWLKRLGERGS